MQEFTLSDLGVFLGVVGGIMASILLTVQKSKCKKITSQPLRVREASLLGYFFGRPAA